MTRLMIRGALGTCIIAILFVAVYLAWHLYWMPRQVTLDEEYNWYSVSASRTPGIHGFVMGLRHDQEHRWLLKKYPAHLGDTLHYAHYQRSSYFPYIERSRMQVPYTPDPY